MEEGGGQGGGGPAGEGHLQGGPVPGGQTLLNGVTAHFRLQGVPDVIVEEDLRGEVQQVGGLVVGS